MKKPGHNFWVHLALVLLVFLLFWLIFAIWLKAQLTPEQASAIEAATVEALKAKPDP